MAQRPPGRHRRPAVSGASRRRGYKIAVAAATMAALAAPASAEVALPPVDQPAASAPDSGDEAGPVDLPDWEYTPYDHSPESAEPSEADEPQEPAEPATPSEPPRPPVEQLTMAASVAEAEPATANLGQLGIPAIMLAAYQRAEANIDASTPNCGLHWSLLAGIGQVESGHARGGRVDAAGTTLTRILGPALDGSRGLAAVGDTDHGEFDADPVHDHAVGPMQFIPSTWLKYAVDGNGDGVASPHNAFDAATAAGEYLCSGGLDLTDPEQLLQAVYRYNHSMSYVQSVLTWANAYARGVLPQPRISGSGPAVDPAPTVPAPAAAPGPPPGPSPGPPPGAAPNAPADSGFPTGSPPEAPPQTPPQTLPPGSSPSPPTGSTPPPPGSTPPATEPTTPPSTTQPPPSTEEPSPSTGEPPPSTVAPSSEAAGAEPSATASPSGGPSPPSGGQAG